jgi:hypothetical protein
MRAVFGIVVVACIGCGSVKNNEVDAAVADSPKPVDASPEAGCQPQMLLVGGTDVTAQGWATVQQPTATLTNGPDFVHLQTATIPGSASGGQLLLNYPGAVDATMPFKIQVVMLVESVTDHNQFDSAAAIMGSFGGGAGVGNDRDQMIYVDNAKIGWADDSESFAVTITDNAFHTFELSVDASAVAHVSVDGVSALTRNGFLANGAIAIGDQTNDPNVESALRIRSVTKLCP